VQSSPHYHNIHFNIVVLPLPFDPAMRSSADWSWFSKHPNVTPRHFVEFVATFRRNLLPTHLQYNDPDEKGSRFPTDIDAYLRNYSEIINYIL